ncbi:hypothetical protein [Erwinia sp. JH02]|uniref:hypothetical protein n=1 Tax=Erwinia sp. JH02 TaxID=2733394 RepID=UPI001487AFB7|nr:hypothetical protein [Erwinia sp. JH02]NNS08761.1 hypothetical protein [Erwinia sp. JH02]
MINIKMTFYLVLSLLLYISIQAQARVVSEITIDEVGAYDERRGNKNEKEACKVYRPTEKQMIRFFNLAKESQEIGSLLHEYYSPCLTTGKIKFKDGASGVWTVQSSGLGLAIFDNGDSATFFLKDNQWTDPYACTYGLGDDPIC